MKAALYNPYLDTLGGGERYCVGVIKAFQKAGYKVDIQWGDKGIVSKLSERFGQKLDSVNVVSNINRGDSYDACFWISDGSVPTLKSRKNILHFQVPFTQVNGKTLINKMKFFRIKHIVVNSEFTKNIIDKEYGVNSTVLYPPVSVSAFKPKRKQNIVSYVGRFSALTQQKHQEIIIEVFKKFYKKNKNWKLVLAGGIEVGNDKFTDKLKEEAKGYPIEIMESPKFSEITTLLGVSKMFWSASGYGVDEEKKPSLVEHFGITVVEAMAAKAIPLICNKGGHKEIVNDSSNGYLWDKKSQLLSNALELSANRKEMNEMAKQAQVQSQEFSEDNFERAFINLL